MTLDQVIEKLKEYQLSGNGELEVKFNDTIYSFQCVSFIVLNPEHNNTPFIQLI